MKISFNNKMISTLKKYISTDKRLQNPILV